jgi:hypothetical protein
MMTNGSRNNMMQHHPMMFNRSRNHMLYAPYNPDPYAPLNFDPPSSFPSSLSPSHHFAFNYGHEFNYGTHANNSNDVRSLNVIDLSPECSPLSVSPSPSFINEDQDLIDAEQITADDVLCGRGAGANTHPGNIKFRTLIGEYQMSYLSSKPLDKANIAKSIVANITSNGGRFLRRSDVEGLDGSTISFWCDIGYKAAREKTCQALRERAPPPPPPPPIDGVHNSGGPLTAASHALGDFDFDESPVEIEVDDRDVLMGRGGITNSHPGNKIYRTHVTMRKEQYSAAPKLKKAFVAKLVTDEIYHSGGRFLLEKQGRWVEISPDKAREKTCQALREKPPERRKRVKHGP